MERDVILNEFRAAGALLEGHFILSSGRRSPVYLQCARVMMDPARGARLCGALAKETRALLDRIGESVDLCVSPAMGGVVVGYETARHMGVASMFAERVDGAFTLRRGFAIPEGARVLMVEDVVTTGLSSRECIAAIRAAGGRVTAAACLVDRSDGAADVGVPLAALLRLPVPSYAPEEIPEALAALPAVKPGSRGLGQ
jgi:orotate phosphoribosyltransferase